MAFTDAPLERFVKSIIGSLTFFTLGLLTAGWWFYRSHPDLNPEDDIPQVHEDVNDVLRRADRAKEAFEEPEKESQQTASDS